MALVGEQFEEAYCDDVCGAVMHKKRNTYKVGRFGSLPEKLKF